MDLAILIGIVLLAILIGFIAYLLILHMSQTQAIAYANSIREWTPPVINNTIECPQGYIITGTNQSGVYQCGPCLAYLAPSGSLTISCPR